MARAASNTVYTFLAWLPVLAVAAFVVWFVMNVYVSVDDAMSGLSLSHAQQPVDPAAGPAGSVGNPNYDSPAELRAQELGGFDCDAPPPEVALEVGELCAAVAG